MGDVIFKLFFLVWLVCFLVAVIVIRWIFKIRAMEAYQKSSMFLLKNIAEKTGVSQHEIEESMQPFCDLSKKTFSVIYSKIKE
jgi:cbb3-type cytochrome oxidase subunit 3